MENRKLRVGFISNSPLLKTGLARNIKCLLPILYKTNKYEIFMLNQSMGDNEPNFQRFPWNNEGAVKNFDQNRMNQDQNYQRIVSYGNLAVEDWVTRNKLDAVLAFDDVWGFLPEFYFKTDWYQNIKDNFLLSLTIDSEPIMPLAKEWAENCKNFYTWAQFAEKKLKQENADKFNHVKTLRGAISSEDFKPLSKNEKTNLRNQFNIKDDEKIILYLGRNQLRKIFSSHMEGLAKFKEKHKDKKVKLLFHTNFSEPGGWPINQIREELKLDKEDVLCTYFCRTCQEWNIQPYDGEDLDCKMCQSSKSRITAGITSTITEKDLNKIYNIADGSASIFTSGGQEYTNVESLLSGIPLACPNYSCGEDFVSSGLVKEIKGTNTREHNSGFKKFVPYIDSIVEFYEYICDLNEDDRIKLTECGREWAIKNFDENVISKQIEQFLDSCKLIDWIPYFDKKKELKNINAQIEDKQTDEEFVKHTYKEILSMNVDDNDSGYQHWMKFLSQNGDKRQLRNSFVTSCRNAAAQHNQKIQPISIETLLDKSDKSRVLLVLKESIGDLVILTSLLPEIKDKYPESSIYIGTDPKYFEIFEMNKYVKGLVPWSQNMDNEMQIVGFGQYKGHFNHYINIGVSTQRILNYLSVKY